MAFQKKISDKINLTSMIKNSNTAYEKMRAMYMNSLSSMLSRSPSPPLTIPSKERPMVFPSSNGDSVPCHWQFKGIYCRYDGVETTCDKSFEQCKKFNNTKNFGGFPPFVPSQERPMTFPSSDPSDFVTRPEPIIAQENLFCNVYLTIYTNYEDSAETGIRNVHIYIFNSNNRQQVLYDEYFPYFPRERIQILIPKQIEIVIRAGGDNTNQITASFMILDKREMNIGLQLNADRNHTSGVTEQQREIDLRNEIDRELFERHMHDMHDDPDAMRTIAMRTIIDQFLRNPEEHVTTNAQEVISAEDFSEYIDQHGQVQVRNEESKQKEVKKKKYYDKFVPVKRRLDV